MAVGLGTILQVEANFSPDKFLALPPDNWGLSNAHAPVGPLTSTGIHLLDLACGVLLLTADVAGRLVARPSEIEVGLVVSFLGAPVLMWLVRRSRTVSV